MKAETRKQKSEGRKQQTEGRERTRTKGHGLGFWLAAGLTLMTGMATPSYGRARHLVAASLDDTITLRVYNYTEASTGVIAQAEKEAGYVFGQAGMKVVWLDCSARNVDPGCSGPVGPFDLALRILPEEKKVQLNLPEDTFGFTLFPSFASVYYSKIETLPASVGANYDHPSLLGDVMAHEIGHLLLGPRHSQAGIMQAHWQTQTLRQGISRSLHFTREQALELRIRASERSKALQADAGANTPR